MCGACRLARRRTGFVAVDTVVVSVVLVPLVRSPGEVVGKFVFGIFDFALLCAKFLSEFDCACWAILYAFAASDAFVFFNASDICASRHVGGVEKLGCTQCVADIDVAVADCKNLVFAVDVGDLVNKTVLLCVAENLHCFFIGDIASLARFTAVISHIADADTPLFTAVAATFAELGSSVTAGADSDAEVSFVLFEPIGDMLDVHGAVFHLDCFLDGNDVHADACASRRNHRRDHSQRKIRHTLEEHRKFGMLVKLLLYHVGEFRRTGNEHRQRITTLFLDRTVLVIVIAVVVFQNADIAHLFDEIVQFVFLDAGIQLFKIFHGVMVTHFHCERNVCHFIGHDATKSPVFGVVCRHAFDLVVDAVRDFSC